MISCCLRGCGGRRRDLACWDYLRNSSFIAAAADKMTIRRSARQWVYWASYLLGQRRSLASAAFVIFLIGSIIHGSSTDWWKNSKIFFRLNWIFKINIYLQFLIACNACINDATKIRNIEKTFKGLFQNLPHLKTRLWLAVAELVTTLHSRTMCYQYRGHFH